MNTTRDAFLATLVIIGAAVTLAADAHAADAVLSGTITSAAGEKLGGVTVSAKPAGGTVTTSVFTDESGNYYFPPLPAGKYRVWAQAVSFATAKAEVDLSAAPKQGFVLNPIKDFVRQLPGNVMLSALPEETDQDKRMKRMVRNNCTGCHTPSYILQHRFDEAGWNAIIELMKNANVYGTFVGNDRKPAGILDYHQKELAAYLARARGPGESAMKFKPDPRPSGESARVMFKEYDVPLDADSGLPSNFVQNDGSDWSLGTPSVLIPGWGVHDAWLDLDGQLWFTCNIPNRRTTIGKIDTKTGEVKLFKLAAPNGLAAQTHGMTRDAKGIIWFNVNNGRGGLGRLDPKTEKIDVYLPPQGMSPTGGATTVDHDGKGRILGIRTGRRLALRSQHGDVHRVQVPHLQDPERYRRHVWSGGRPRRQWLVGGDDTRHHRQRRRCDRQVAGGQARRGEGRNESSHSGGAHILRDLQPA